MNTETEADIDTLVLAQLEQKRGDWPAIAAKAGVSYSWLSKFANNKIPNPGIDTLKKLRNAMAPAGDAVPAEKAG